jgi:hypothetical protein
VRELLRRPAQNVRNPERAIINSTTETGIALQRTDHTNSGGENSGTSTNESRKITRIVYISQILNITYETEA